MSDRTVRLYLLGALRDPDAAEVEERYFSDPEFFRVVRAAEVRLIEDYLRNRLPSSSRHQFEELYLVRPELLRRLREVESSQEFLARSAAGPFSFTGWNRRFAALGIAALFCLTVAGLFVWQQTSRPAVSARLERPPSVPFLDVELAPGVAKGPSEKSGVVSVPAVRTQIRFLLEFPGRPFPAGGRAEILRLDQNGARLAAAPGGPLLQVTNVPGTGAFVLDSSVLTPADYLIEVHNPRGELLETFLFRAQVGK